MPLEEAMRTLIEDLLEYLERVKDPRQPACMRRRSREQASDGFRGDPESASDSRIAEEASP